jgi:hypothetical protein
MEEVVQHFEIFKKIFYLKFLKLSKVLFGLVEFWKELELFEPEWNFEFKWNMSPLPLVWLRGAHDGVPTSLVSLLTVSATAGPESHRLVSAWPPLLLLRHVTCAAPPRCSMPLHRFKGAEHHHHSLSFPLAWFLLPIVHTALPSHSDDPRSTPAVGAAGVEAEVVVIPSPSELRSPLSSLLGPTSPSLLPRAAGHLRAHCRSTEPIYRCQKPSPAVVSAPSCRPVARWVAASQHLAQPSPRGSPVVRVRILSPAKQPVRRATAQRQCVVTARGQLRGAAGMGQPTHFAC